MLKMHQILFRLELRSRPRWGDYSARPEPLAGRASCKEDGRRIQEGNGREREGKKCSIPPPTFE